MAVAVVMEAKMQELKVWKLIMIEVKAAVMKETVVEVKISGSSNKFHTCY